MAICCCHCHPLGLCPPGSPSQPLQELQWCLWPVGRVCWEWASPLGGSFCSRADSRAFGLLSFRVGLQKCLKGRRTMRFVQVVHSDPTWQPVLCVGGCCALALQGMNVPFPVQPSRSQRLLEEYLPFPSLGDNFISTCCEPFLEFSWRKPHSRGVCKEPRAVFGAERAESCICLCCPSLATSPWNSLGRGDWMEPNPFMQEVFSCADQAWAGSELWKSADFPRKHHSHQHE